MSPPPDSVPQLCALMLELERDYDLLHRPIADAGFRATR